MIVLRPLTADDIPNLPQIRPTYQSNTILTLERSGEGIEVGWQFIEQRLAKPYDKGILYNFNEGAQKEILARLLRPDVTYLRVAESNGQLVGIADAEILPWNNTVFLWNLMIDIAYRGQGLGRRLWHRVVEFARDAEVRAITIETQNTNVPACKFYLRMGCQLTGFNEALYSNDNPNREIALFWTYFMPK